ncbi:hypothetical protein KC19_9G151100 [Ceratodon purpureus]|uniref:Uncharacterized protein n=1 Tax=Ceratodon purpureus TaxID=3225 RepID=A0A8T0GVP7_CERPU|nr:hypothetical protein KC19_9G151100 [Ceratodon purpureus]
MLVQITFNPKADFSLPTHFFAQTSNVILTFYKSTNLALLTLPLQNPISSATSMETYPLARDRRLQSFHSHLPSLKGQYPQHIRSFTAPISLHPGYTPSTLPPTTVTPRPPPHCPP